jgi:hypothetical protein
MPRLKPIASKSRRPTIWECLKACAKYFVVLNRHRRLVRKECFKRGLYWRGLTHDLSKFGGQEFFPYALYYYLPPECVDHGITEAAKRAWLLHLHLNDHHWQYWVLREDSGRTIPVDMSHSAVLEMISDWVGAGKSYQDGMDILDWYAENSEKMIMSPNTRALVSAEMDAIRASRS